MCELALRVASVGEAQSPRRSSASVAAPAAWPATSPARLGWPLEIPAHAEVISSIGDALSLIRAERERTVTSADSATLEAMMADVEAEVVAAGASPASVEVRVEEVPERSILRAIAVGAVGLTAGATPGRDQIDADTLRARAGNGTVVRPAGRYWLLQDGDEIEVLDRYGDEAIRLRGEEVPEDELAAAIERLTRYRGPITLRPTTWIIDDRRLARARRRTGVDQPLRRTAGRHVPRRKAALMALYISAGRRFRRTLVIAVAAAVVAFAIGWLIGHQQVPSIAERVAEVQQDGESQATGLERLGIEYEQVLAGTDDLDSSVLQPLDDLRAELQSTMDRAPWLTSDERAALLDAVSRSARTQSTACRSIRSRRRRRPRQHSYAKSWVGS